MQLKHTMLALAAAGLLSTQAYASEAPIEALQPAQAAAFSEADLNALFDNAGKPMQLAALSGQEMRETEGALWMNVLGGLAGMYGSGYGYLAGGGRNPYGFMGAAAAGFAGGAVMPVNGIRAGIGAFGSGFSSGFVGGYGSRRGWW